MAAALAGLAHGADLRAELAEARTAAKLAAENTKRYQDTYSDIYFDLGSLTVAEFERRVAAGETVYAYIGRPSCGDCNAFEPLFKRYIAKHALDGKIWFVNVHRLHQDAEKWAAFKQRYGLSGTPVLAKYAGGRQRNKLDFEADGGIGGQDLERWLRLNGL
ncbi:thioredoxin family protein [Kingella potus]|uniref:thioredoxin family protein n=1 Tax=Kingella potus TaxID=265175 RepID=UPI003CCC563A